ncbi:MAG: hypothetical protein M4579_004793 [Chaenotheca gracillima]|nr:MAG: hypothetical protein M4579_004793 [Chaenotheca gracillima]
MECHCRALPQDFENRDNPDQYAVHQDFFYICDGHLLDKGFCTPIIDEEAVKRAAQEAKEREIEQVKKEYEEKQKKKAEKKKKSKEKDEKKDKDQKVDDEGEDAKEEPTKTTKAKDDDGSTTKDKAGEAPRIFSLHKYCSLSLHTVQNFRALRPLITEASIKCGLTGSETLKWPKGTETA